MHVELLFSLPAHICDMNDIMELHNVFFSPQWIDSTLHCKYIKLIKLQKSKK